MTISLSSDKLIARTQQYVFTHFWVQKDNPSGQTSQIFELHRTVNPTKVNRKTSDIIVCVPDFEVKVVPCDAAFHISPDKLNCIQICMVGRESEKFVSILQYKRVRLKCWFWLVHLVQMQKGLFERICV